MEQPVVVTVAICTWNRSTELRSTLESLAAADAPSQPWELLVVNNNGTDDTDEVVASFGGRLPVRLLHEPTPGKAHACNRAIREARGEWILWTDDDVLVDRRWMQALLEELLQPGTDWAFGRSLPHWPHNPPVWYSHRFRGYLAVLDYGPVPFVVKDRFQPFYGLNYGGRREAHERLGGFRTVLGPKAMEGGGWEDIDMFERAFDAGMCIRYTPEALVNHVIAPVRTTKQYHTRRQWGASGLYYGFLNELFPDTPRLLGLPRFMYRKAVTDTADWARAFCRRDKSAAFYYELQLLRFARLWFEALRHGFRAPSLRTVHRRASGGDLVP